MDKTKKERPNTQTVINKEAFEELCKQKFLQKEIFEHFRLSRTAIDNWCRRTYGESLSAAYKRLAGETNKGGTQYVYIDRNQFETLCSLLSFTQEKIADFFGCSVSTLKEWCYREYGQNYSNVVKQKRTKGEAELAKNQLELSKTNASMAIFLGKQYLNQRDNPGEDNNSMGDITFKFVRASEVVKRDEPDEIYETEEE